jgi:hypothetical protein
VPVTAKSLRLRASAATYSTSIPLSCAQNIERTSHIIDIIDSTTRRTPDTRLHATHNRDLLMTLLQQDQSDGSTHRHGHGHLREGAWSSRTGHSAGRSTKRGTRQLCTLPHTKRTDIHPCIQPKRSPSIGCGSSPSDVHYYAIPMPVATSSLRLSPSNAACVISIPLSFITRVSGSNVAACDSQVLCARSVPGALATDDFSRSCSSTRRGSQRRAHGTTFAAVRTNAQWTGLAPRAPCHYLGVSPSVPQRSCDCVRAEHRAYVAYHRPNHTTYPGQTIACDPQPRSADDSPPARPIRWVDTSTWTWTPSGGCVVLPDGPQRRASNKQKGSEMIVHSPAWKTPLIDKSRPDACALQNHGPLIWHSSLLSSCLPASNCQPLRRIELPRGLG